MAERPEFDVVNKAAHYNAHPSGIEAKHIVRCLNFNLGNACKYVMRRHGKEYDRSLRSAEFYLKDQLDHDLPRLVDRGVYPLLKSYAAHEPSKLAQRFYHGLNEFLLWGDKAVGYQMLQDIETLRLSGE